MNEDGKKYQELLRGGEILTTFLTKSDGNTSEVRKITATQQLIFLTSEVLPSPFVKGVVRISPPLKNS